MNARGLLAACVLLVVCACSRGSVPSVGDGAKPHPIVLHAIEDAGVAPITPAPSLDELPKTNAPVPPGLGDGRPLVLDDPAGRALLSFGADLFRASRSGVSEDASFVVSPLSLAAALAVAHAGARGETAREIERALHLSAEVTPATLASLERSSSFTRRASALFASRSVFQTFRETVQRDLFAEVLALDDPAGARARVDAWAREKTRQGMPNLLDRPIGGEDVLVLLDALYAAGEWTIPFAKDRTRSGRFDRLKGERVDVPMMASRALRRARAAPDFDAVELAAGEEHSLIVVVPARGTFASFEHSLDAAAFRGVLGSLARYDVDLTLPRFNVRSRNDVGEALRSLGVRSAFARNRADFSGISREATYIDRAVHGAGLEVDERGVKTVAATAIVMTKAMPAPPSIVIHVDRPFVFALVNVETGAPIVLGRYMGP